MIRIASIVEGHGDVEAVPVLLRRLAADWDPTVPFAAAKPIRVPRGKLVKQGELERAIQFASLLSMDGGILVLLDADDDCPATLGPALLARSGPTQDRTAVVVAKSEFESWFLAGATSIAGRRGLAAQLVTPDHPESIRDAKGWLTRHMDSPAAAYSETLDQPALAAIFDFGIARLRSDSLDKLCRDVTALLGHLRAVNPEN